MHRHRKRAWCLVLLGVAALFAGCRDAGPTSPADGAAAVTVRPAGPVHSHDHLVAALQHRVEAFVDAQERGLTFQLAKPAAGEPVPIPGGFAPGIHTWIPGPPELAPFFMGTDVEPNVITNFSGFMAMAYLTGPATGSDGNTYDQFHDMRIMRGTFVDSEGRHQHGTFAFI